MSRYVGFLYLGATIALIFSTRRAIYWARSSGYWRGRLDETAYTVALGALLDEHERDDFPIGEARLLIAQQAEAFGVSAPGDWPTWDGIDRLAVYLPAGEIADALYGEPVKPGLLRRLFGRFRA
jgi:hypothetical protein